MRTIKWFYFTFIFILFNALYSQQVLDPLNYITVDNLNDNNTGTSGTILCDTTYCETGPINPSSDNNGWWSQIDVQSISYGRFVRVTPRLTGTSRPNGSKAKFYLSTNHSDKYLVYTYLFASGNATSNAYITFRRFGESLYVDSLKYDQTIHQIFTTGSAGAWVPWKIIDLPATSQALEVTIGADSLTQPFMRADAVRILRSIKTGADLEFGRRDFNGFDSIRVTEVFPQINFKFREFYDKVIKLFNLGDSDLVVTNLSFTTSRFSALTPFPFIISPGQYKDVIIRFSPKGEEFTYDSLKIISNDWSEPTAYLPVYGEGINYNFIMNASENGSEPHWNAPLPANYSEIGLWQNSTSKSPAVYPIPGGNIRSRYYPVNNDIPVAIYSFKIPDTLSGNYILEYSGPYTSNSTTTAEFNITTPFISDTFKIKNFNQNIPFNDPVFWRRISDDKTRIFNLNGGGQTTINLTRSTPGVGVLRADLIRVRLLPIAPTASTSADVNNRTITYNNVSIYDSIRLAEFNYQKILQIRSNGETPLVVDSIRLTGKDRHFFKIENMPPVLPITLPSIDGILNLVIFMVPRDTIIYDTIWNVLHDSIKAIDTIQGGIRNYSADLRFTTNDTVNNKVITIKLNGNGVGNLIFADDSDINTYVNTEIINYEPGNPTALHKWQRILGSGNNNQRIFTYIYGYNYSGLTPDSNYIEWFPNILRRPNGPVTEIDSFNVYAVLPVGSIKGNPRAIYEIYSPVSGVTRIYKNQNSVSYGGDVSSNGRISLGRFQFLRGGNDIHGSGVIFGHIKLINSFSEVTDYYKDSLVNSALIDSFVTRADAIILEQVSRITEVNKEDNNLNEFILYQNFPNPFNSSTNIRYSVPIDSDIKIKIFDILGREVRLLVNSFQKKGKYSIIWDGKNNNNLSVSSGIYIYTISGNNNVISKKMLLLK